VVRDVGVVSTISSGESVYHIRHIIRTAVESSLVSFMGYDVVASSDKRQLARGVTGRWVTGDVVAHLIFECEVEVGEM
jgi:hypothetical protein